MARNVNVGSSRIISIGHHHRHQHQHQRSTRHSHNRNGGSISMRRWLSAIAIMTIMSIISMMVAAPDAILSMNMMMNGVCANAKSSGSGSSFIGRSRRMGRRRNNEEKENANDSGGLTLGDLDEIEMMQNSQSSQSSEQGSAILGPSTIFGQQQQQQQQEQGEEETAPNPNPNQLKRSLGRINLDLSGRIMCHIISPPRTSHKHGDFANNGRERSVSVPLISLPSSKKDRSIVADDDHNQSQGAAASSSQSLVHETKNPMPNNTLNMQKMQITQRQQRRFIPIPHVFIGANYDLDQVWYGATRWIGKCSWGPNSFFGGESDSISNSPSPSPSASETSTTLTTLTNTHDPAAWQLITDSFCRKVFPSFSSSPFVSRSSSSSASTSPSSSSWTVDVEGEQSVFDSSDTTARLRLIHQPSSLSSILPSSSSKEGVSSMGQQQQQQHQTLPSQISVEYDSAKYYEQPSNTHKTLKKSLQYAPTMTMGLKLPILHPRLELHSKRTWIVKEGGDDNGNYYGGDHYNGGSSSGNSQSCVDRRLESIKKRYREGIPRSSNSNSNPNQFNDGNRKLGTIGTIGRRLSRWLENDGWMPRKVTADLMGNLVSVSEVGGCFVDDANRATKADKGPVHNAIQNAGIRLRISKRMDWTSMGIFPWSKSTNNNSQSNDSGGGGGGVLDALRSTRVRLELCSLYGAGGEGRASVGVDVDPLDWGRTLKVIVAHEDVGVLGGGMR